MITVLLISYHFSIIALRFIYHRAIFFLVARLLLLLRLFILLQVYNHFADTMGKILLKICLAEIKSSFLFLMVHQRGPHHWSKNKDFFVRMRPHHIMQNLQNLPFIYNIIIFKYIIQILKY